jgi:hypothetical protein
LSEETDLSWKGLWHRRGECYGGKPETCPWHTEDYESRPDLQRLNNARHWWMGHMPWEGHVPSDAEVLEAYAKRGQDAGTSEPLPEWERELLESDGYKRGMDAAELRNAATVVRERFRHTFALLVIARTLERLADRLAKRP